MKSRFGGQGATHRPESDYAECANSHNVYDRLIFFMYEYLSDLRLHKHFKFSWGHFCTLIVTVLCCTWQRLLIVRVYPWVLHKNIFLSLSSFFSNVSLVKARNINNFSHGYDRWIIRRQLIQCAFDQLERSCIIETVRDTPLKQIVSHPNHIAGHVVPDKVIVQQTKIETEKSWNQQHVQGGAKKWHMQTQHLILAHNLGKCWPIFEILSPFAEVIGKNHMSCLYDPLFCAIPCNFVICTLYEHSY